LVSKTSIKFIREGFYEKVVYKSKTGFARRYAEIIARELAADVKEAREVSFETLSSYDAIVYGGGLYAAGINGVSLILKNLSRLKGKKIAVFASGASVGRENEIKDIVGKNFTPEDLLSLRFFYLRGGFDYSRLNPADKVLMSVMKWMIKRKKESERTPDEKGLLSSYEHPVDFVGKENAAALLAFMKE